MAKIVHITSVHAPSDIRIFHKQCRSLAAAGFQVTLIAPTRTDETIDGVTIRGVPKATNRINRMIVTSWHILRAALHEEADVYHFHDPELMFVGLLLRLRGKRVIYDVHEDTPKQVLDKHWIPSPLRAAVGRALGWAESIAARCWSGIVTATPTIATRFPPSKTITINNYPLTEQVLSSREHQRDGVLVSGRAIGSKQYDVAYVGCISHSRGMIDLLSAIDRLASKQSPKLALAGRFEPASLEAEARAHRGWRHVEYLGWQARDEICQLLQRSRIGVAPLHALPRYVESQPVKLYEYMLAGLPVVVSDFPGWRKIVQTSGCGLLVRPNDPKDLAEAIAWLLAHPVEATEMGRRGQESVLRNYHWQGEAVRLLDFYRRILDEDHDDRRRTTPVREVGHHQSSAA